MMLTEKDKEAMETKSQIQKQLSKIVHRTWYIFDEDKKLKCKDTLKHTMKHKTAASNIQ